MRSITFKLTLAFLLVGLTGALLVSIIFTIRTRIAFNQFIQNNQQQVLADNLVQYYQQHGSWSDVLNSLSSITGNEIESSPGGPGSPPGRMRFTLVDANRTIIVGGPNERIGQTASDQEMAGAIALTVNGKTVGWLLQPPAPGPWSPNSPEARFLQEMNSDTLVSAGVAVFLALLLGGLLAFTMTRSLRELTEATDEISRGKLGRQVKVRSGDELGTLAKSFNKMSLDLARAVQARRQMTADIAHDLRSPLSVISGYAEALSDGKLPGTPEVYDILNHETQHLSRLVEDLRLLSLADAGELMLNLEPSDPRRMLESVATRQAVAAQQKGISLRVEAGQDLSPVRMDPERMAQVFDNLVMNAFRYTPQGGEIVLAAKAVDGTVELEVRDNGSGITAEDLPYVFDRFYRGDKTRYHSGESGLGLAIARSIVEAHGGTITVKSTPGQGALFTITLATSP